MHKIKKFIKIPYCFIINGRKKIRNFLFPTARILLYHRVADIHNDPYSLCVSIENFRQQVKFFKENFRIVPLVKLAQDIRAGKVQRNTIVITFDDGYADNLHNALPILEEFKVPATIFMTVGYINQNKHFYWDENTPPDDRGRPMTLEETKQLSNSHLIEIGGHTMSHPKLSKLPEKEQLMEIANGKKRLEEFLNVPLLSFAYPFGGKDSFDEKTIELVKKAGFNYACSNIHEKVTNFSNIYALPRFLVKNWDAEKLKREIKKWI